MFWSIANREITINILMEDIIIMDVMDAINLLKTYGLYNKAQSECKQKKIDNSPYDMQGHHEVYCSYLSKKWVQLRNERDKVHKCSELVNILEEVKPAHDVCSFAIYSRMKDYFEKKCKYYHGKVLPLTRKMNEQSEAIKVLNGAADQDYWLR